MSGLPVTVYLYPESCALPRMERLRDAAARRTGRDASQWTRAEQAYGKPYFPEAPEVHFSVSHSGDWWACAFGDSPLGLDLQQHLPCSVPRLSHRFFHAEEDAYLRSLGYDAAEFFRVWSAKESWVKRTGEGFRAGLENFSVLSPLPDGSVLQQLDAPAGYSMCLCTCAPAAVTVIHIAAVP